MASQHMSVFGLTFRQHDNRYMQQILRHYGRLPTNPGNRAELYIELAFVAREVDEDESLAIETWLRDGGEFPLTPILPQPPEFRGRPFQPGFEDGDFEIDDFDTGDRTGEYVGFNPQRFPDDEEEPEHERESEERTADGEDEEGPEFDNHGPGASESVLTPTAVPPSADIECDVCMESFAASGFPPTSRITSSCDHEGICCLHCIQETLGTAIREGALNRLTCPMCPEKLSYQEIKAYASREIFERYDYLLMANTPGLYMCLGPRCGSGQIHENTGTEPMMVCNACQFRTCVFHGLPWHEGQTCEEFDCDDSQIERLEADEATAKLLIASSQICPSCKQGVTKQDGCDHMQCRCGNQWCFVCGVHWENIIRMGPTAHAVTCTYHPQKVRLRADQQAAHSERIKQLVHGRPVSEALEKARKERNMKRIKELRPLAAEAAEKRMKENAKVVSPGPAKKRRLKLLPAWEER